MVDPLGTLRLRSQQPLLILYWCNGEVPWSCGPNRGRSVEEPEGKETLWQRLERTERSPAH